MRDIDTFSMMNKQALADFEK